MNIKTRLSLQFTLIFMGILVFFSILVYYFSNSSQHSKFRENLLDSAKNTATLLINVAEVDSTLLKKIQESTTSWEEEELAITDQGFNIIYSNNINYLADKKSLAEYVNGPLNYFSVEEKDGVYYRHIFNERIYNVFIMAFDRSRMENLSDLRKILLWSIIFSIWLSVLFSYLFSRRAIRPISEVINNVKKINSLRLSTRLDEGNKKDEIAQLAITFNEMLTNLEIAFKNQEEFVSNASHELRTPLTIMIGESDYLLNRDRDKEEYIKHISDLVNDLKSLNFLINNLLELAQINRYKNITLTQVRIDEAFFKAIHIVKNKYPGRKVIPKIKYPENDNELIIFGNAGLLEIAFKNLLDNACKFSNEDVGVEFIINDQYIIVIISDKGIGIPEGELNSLYKPFNRASNVKFISGFGIGLSLVSKIMELHGVKTEVKSKVNEGTKVNLQFERSSGGSD